MDTKDSNPSFSPIIPLLGTFLSNKNCEICYHFIVFYNFICEDRREYDTSFPVIYSHNLLQKALHSLTDYKVHQKVKYISRIALPRHPFLTIMCFDSKAHKNADN